MEEIRVKTTNLITNGDFWLLDGQPYFGKYHIWTDGKAMTESRFNGGKSKELIISPDAKNIVEYDFLTEKNQRGGQYAMQERPLPTKSDYKKGFFTNIKGIFEKFKDIYDSEQLSLQRNKR